MRRSQDAASGKRNADKGDSGRLRRLGRLGETRGDSGYSEKVERAEGDDDKLSKKPHGYVGQIGTGSGAWNRSVKSQEGSGRLGICLRVARASP